MAISCSTSNLVNAAKCFCGIARNESQYRSVMLYLWCQAANATGGGGSSCLYCQLVDPTALDVPACDCALWMNLLTRNLWVWDASGADWIAFIAGP
jgi:hypothetical protein